jgi:hypothetical protein
MKGTKTIKKARHMPNIEKELGKLYDHAYKQGYRHAMLVLEAARP